MRLAQSIASIPSHNVGFHFTRQEAIDDGQLIDVSTEAKVVGFRCPVAISNAAFSSLVSSRFAQDVEQGVAGTALNPIQQNRLSELIWTCYGNFIIKGKRPQAEFVFAFQVSVDHCTLVGNYTVLKAMVSRGDKNELVVTIKLSDEV